jgi:hypothetical protein
MKKQATFYSLLLLLAFTFNSCSKDEELLKDKIIGSAKWYLSYDCSSGLIFSDDYTGQVWYSDGCIPGKNCNDVLTFDWELDGTQLTVTYNTGATILCSNVITNDEAYLLPAPETVNLEGNPITITLYGATYQLLK